MKRQILISSLILLFIQTFASAAVLYVPSRDYPTIQSAITDAVNDDVVVVAPGVYSGHDNVDLDFGGRAITVKSEINPGNPEPGIIAATIIDCQGTRYDPHRAFHFHHNEDPNSKVLGFTIRNGYQRGPAGAAGQFGYNGQPVSLFVPIPPCDDPLDCPPYALDGDPCTGDGYGGAILCDAASPTIQYCVISNSTVTGAQGGDGARGQDGPWEHFTLADFNEVTGILDPNAEPTENPDGQWGGSGGAGSGNGYGGAIACLDDSSPIISDCTISDNFARGGCGGVGGDGGYATKFPNYDQGLEGGGGNAGDSIGDGIGGAIYAENGSNPIVTNCTFSSNIAATGIRGAGGQRGLGNEDDPRAPKGSDGWVFSTGGIAGGAAYYNTNSDPNFTNCTFSGNKAYEAYMFYDPYFGGEDISAYTVGGALYSLSNSSVTLNTCEFTDNLGGAVYCEPDCNLNFDDCSFADNSKTANGGALYIDTGCTVNIQSCIFGGNSAYDDGGAVKCRSDANLTNCSFGNNVADSDNDGYGYGGAIDAYQHGTTLVIDVNACSFAANQSIYGGGFSSENFDANFTDCYFIGNTAREGGGLDLVNGHLSVTGGIVKGNNATDGDGGGFNCRYSIAEIRDCTISDNFADGIYPTGGSGGAINFYGGATTQVVFNCLITGNLAAVDGGAISCSWFRSGDPEIGNCTFSDNLAGDYGGAIFSDWGSDPQITDSIFQNNNSHAIHEQNFGGDAIVKYSLFYGNPDGDYYESDTSTVYDFGSVADPNGNFNKDPLFVIGPLGEFYLRQQPVQPLPQSPAVNTGSADANDPNIELDTYTTRTDSVGDANQLDRGYHYIDIADVDTFQLTASVVGGQGTAEPTAPEPLDYNSVSDTYTYYAGTVVTLTATPDACWRVKTWRGTDDDSSTAKTNSVVMNCDRDVTVEFEQPRTLIVEVGGGYDPPQGYFQDIQDAIHHSEDGDTIVVYPGIYYGPEIQINKSVEIRSKHPDDPCCVAATIIDRTGYANRAFRFQPGADGAILNGFTIQNCRWFVLDGGDAKKVGQNGEDGIGAQGAALYIPADIELTIKNCIIRDNWIRGGHGGDGYNADNKHNAGRGGWGAWARGGAIYCATNSNIEFINCQIIDNEAVGGNGGDGGDRAALGGLANYGGNWSRAEWYNIDPRDLTVEWVQGDLWEKWTEMAPYTSEFSGYIIDDQIYFGYFGDYRWYSGYGGAVFCNTGSNVTFTDCTISGNLAQGGMSGEGGERPGENPEPEISYEIPSFGGGVYCAAESTVTFTGCTMTENISSEPTYDHGIDDPSYDPDNTYCLDPYLGHGGGVCAEDTATVIFTDSTFSENQAAVGGGIHFANANPIISDCNLAFNSAYHGGGLFGEHGPATIIGCNIINNEAISPPNDPNIVILGEGGGLHLWAADADIIDCNISSNQAEVSGGGVYFGGESAPLLTNCLLTDNIAGRDGAGVSTNIFTQLTISNCTIVDNIVTGSGFEHSYGGGLYCSYENYTNIIDSIIWGNLAGSGSQLAIGTGFEYDLRPSTVNVSYSVIGPRYAYLGFISDASFVGGSGQGGGTTLVDGQTIYDQFDAGQERVKVIVSLFEPVEMREATDWDSPESVGTLRAEIASRQSAVLSTLTPAEFSLRHRFENQAGFSGEVTIEGLNKLLDNPSVEHIEPVREVYPALAQAIPLANALEARQVYDGNGIAVAIVDTGVDYTHPRLGNDGFPNAKVIGGYDTGNNDDDPMPVGAAHGTCCAGIAAGDLGTVGDYIGGVACGAKIYALKASIDYAGSFLNDALLASWDWCVTHRDDDPDNPIMAMNNSWAIWGVPFNDPDVADAFAPAFTVAADTAVAAGITILAAAGNDGFAGDGITWPAAMSKVISVGAVYDTNDAVTPYSNTADNLDILAPADPVYTTDIAGPDGYTPGDYFPYFNGTSSSCPFAAGALASLQSAARAETGSYLTPAQARNLLVISGHPVTDTKVAITKPRVNLGMAIDYLTSGPIYIEEGCQIKHGWWDPETQSWDPNSHNLDIDDDPNFVAAYYLSQIAAGQLFDSNCVDAGSDLAANLGLDTYITRTDSFPDTYDPNNPDPCSVIVDMGYHYPLFVAPQYELTVRAFDVNGLEDANLVEPNYGFYDWYTTVELTVTTPVPQGYQVLWTGTDNDESTEPNNTVTMDSEKVVTVTFVKNAYELTIEVIGSNGRLFAEWRQNADPCEIEAPNSVSVKRGTVVNLTAEPDEDYRLKQWTGTNDDTSTEPNNTVTMYSDKTITVEFEPPATITVPGDYPTIERAIAAARDGDKIIIATGVYYTRWFTIDKEIMLTSTNPDDPNVVAATIIDPLGLAFWFTSNAGPGAILNGLTIANGGRGAIPAPDGRNPGDDGQDGYGLEGGAIYCDIGSSPTIKNCIIRDFRLWGGDAGDGADANEAFSGGRGGWGGWARGGGVYVANDSSPTFINCTISNCTATGGDGGDGGDGAEGETDGIPWWQPPGYGGNWSDGYLWQYWGYIGDYRFYSGYGGGVYCDVNSSPTFIACTITGNSTQGGMSGIGGLTPQGLITNPVQSYEIPSYGGGVYCGAGSTVEFIGCNITNNTAPKPGIDEVTGEVVYHLDPYLGHGGGIAFEETASVIFKEYVSPTAEVRNCVISGNVASVGGGMYWADPCTAPEIIDCNVSSNLAYQGGGLFGTKGSAIIENCIIQDNFAGTAPNDVDDVAGQGGGIYSASMVAEIFDCSIFDNEAGASGGGIFFTGIADDSPIVTNCLVTGNEAGRDGGGISVNWYAEPIIANCTVVGNQATGNFGEIGNTGFGGGLYCSYHSNSEVIDSIFWNNYAVEGDEITVGTGFEFDPRPATLTVSYCDIQGGRATVQVDNGCTLLWDVDPGDPNYPTNINADPLFVTGPLGDYYLSQTDANSASYPGQDTNSPCVDAGSDYASRLAMNRYTTRTDSEFDKGKVDMGYHYPLPEEAQPCRFCDLVYDGIINFRDFAELALHWLEEGCCDANDWCDGADLTFDTYVNFEDLAIFVECWLIEDTSAPIPNPSEWEIEPHSTSTAPPYSISMTARTAVDAWGWNVQYYFECTTDDVNSGWRDEPNWPHTDLDPNTEYGYRVKTRDELGNQTEWSVIRYWLSSEVAAAEPPTWLAEPYATSPNSIEMVATASDSNGIAYVEYYFEETSGNPGGSDSGWQNEPNYTDTGLDPNTTYTYRVRAIDENGRTTGWSDPLSATTFPEGVVPDTTAPTPDPMQWDESITPTGLPREIYGSGGDFDYYATMTAVVATDDNYGVQYRFICTTNASFSSNWRSLTTYTVLVGASGQAHEFYVIARDLSPNYNETGPSSTEAAIPR